MKALTPSPRNRFLSRFMNRSPCVSPNRKSRKSHKSRKSRKSHKSHKSRKSRKRVLTAGRKSWWKIFWEMAIRLPVLQRLKICHPNRKKNHRS